MKHFIITIFIVHFILAAFAQNNVIIEALDAQVDVGSEIMYPITINPNRNTLIAFTLDIEYDNNLFQISGLEGPSNWTFSSNNIPGLFKLGGYYAVNPFDPEDRGQTTTFEAVVTFKAIGVAGQTSQMKLLNGDFFADTEQRLNYQTLDGSISINGCDGCNPCRNTDSLALVAVYDALNGDNWYSWYKWDLNQPMDTWYGVTLNANGCVGKVDLDEKGISGTISPEIGKLSELTILDLAENKISGELPASIGNLTNLEVLALSQNQLTGNIPTTISNLTNLKYLYLSSNQLSGIIPSAIGNLTNLLSLSLASNQLRDNIPTTFGSLTNLESVSISNNNLTGSLPSTIGNLTNIKNLNLQNNQLTGVNSAIGNLTNLEDLRLRNNLLSSLPSTIGNLSKLKVLWVDNNQLRSLPSTINNLDNLHSIDFSFNQLRSLPSTIGSISNLKYLDVSNNQLTTIPSTIGNLNSLKRLNVNNNQLTNLPSTIGNMGELQNLAANDNKITGNMPSWFLSMDKLRYLTIQNNQFTGCYASGLSQLCNKLSWYGTNINISDGNNFDAPWEDFCARGTVACEPQTTCRQTDSLALVAVYNALNGDNWYSFYQWDLTQPMDTWRGITLNSNGCVDKVDMDERGIRGTLPTEIGNLSEITMLDFEENNISGPIPASIGNLTNLKVLALRENQFSDGIPSEIGNLTNLETLDLSQNQLTGNIPLTIGGLTNLRYLNLAYNNMSGCLDPALSPLCSQLTFADINTGNDFTISTGDFCSGLACGNNKNVQAQEVDTHNYPNPFTDHTTIEYVLPKESQITFTVYDGMGKQVALLHKDETKQTGTHSINFNSKNYPPGIYYYALQAGDYIETQKMILIR